MKRFRDAIGYSQRGLADFMGIPVATLRDWEQGKRVPSFPAGVALANALGVESNELLKEGGG